MKFGDLDEFPYVGEGGDLDEAGDMTSLRKNKTGVDNTMFISTKGYGQHGPRIKIHTSLTRKAR